MIFSTIILLTSMLTVIGIHLKYGFFLGMDAFSEYGIIKEILVDGHFSRSTLADFPLSYIEVSSLSLITGTPLISGVWNLFHLLTNATISLVVFLIINKIFNGNVAFLASFFVLYHPTNIILGLSMTRENLALLLLLLSIYIIITQLKSKNDPSYIIIFVIFTIGYNLSHYTTSYFGILIIIIFMCSLGLFSIKKEKKPRIFYLLFPCVLLLSWWSYSILGVKVVSVATKYIQKMMDFITFNNKIIDPTHHEAVRLSNYSDVTILLFNVQALLIVIGSILLIYYLLNKKFDFVQSSFVIVSLFCTLLIGMWYLIPELSQSLYISRILRYTILFNCVSISILLIELVNMINNKIIKHHSNKKHLNIDIIRTLSILIILCITIPVLVYPISQNITRYIGFSSDEYPSDLNDEMYNIRSTNEMLITTFVSEHTGDNISVIMEMPLSRMKNYFIFNGPIIMMNQDNLFVYNESYILIRKSLFENGQFIHGPVGLNAPYSANLNETDVHLLKSILINEEIIYSQNDYKFYYRDSL